MGTAVGGASPQRAGAWLREGTWWKQRVHWRVPAESIPGRDLSASGHLVFSGVLPQPFTRKSCGRMVPGGGVRIDGKVRRGWAPSTECPREGLSCGG